jgi:hypothetical protein
MAQTTAMDILNRRTATRNKAVAIPTQLEFWSEKVRGLPNTLARCALFTAAGKKEVRSKLQEAVVFSVQGFTLIYSGQELRQDDQDVFLQLVHMTRGVPVGHKLEITGYAILKAIGWGTGGRDYTRLRESIERLADTKIKITGTDMEFRGGLLPSMTRVGDSASSKFSLWLDPSVISLFGENAYTLVDWDMRLTLGSLAKWFHSFYFTHREPLGYRVETLHRLCGSRSTAMRSFRSKLRDALDELVAIGFLDSYEIINDVVHVKRHRAIAAAAAA